MKSTKKIIALLACMIMVASPIATISVQTSQNGIGDVEGYVPMGCNVTIVYDGVSQLVEGTTTSSVEIPSSSKEGHTFLYWNFNGSAFYPGTYTMINLYNMSNGGTINLTSVWSNKSYTASFYDGQNFISSKTCAHDEKMGSLPTASKSGYTFLGWSPSGSTSDIINSDTYYTATYDRAFYAVWAEKTYTVYLINDDKGVGTIGCTYNKTYGTLPTLTKDGYSFKGWSTDKSGSNMVNSNTKYLNTADSYLYAVWETKQFKISFIDNGIEVGSKNLLFSTPIGTMPELIETGRTFLGWSTDGTVEGIVAPDKVFSDFGNINLYSVWKTNEYTLTFMDNDTELYSKTILYGSEYGQLPSPMMIGHTFIGWSLDGTENGIVGPTSIYGFDSDIKLYSVWKVNTYTMSFIDGDSQTESKEISYGSKIGTMPTLTCDGKEFVGWSLDGTERNKITSIDTYDWDSDTVLYAMWNDVKQPIETGISSETDVIDDIGNTDDTGTADGTDKGPNGSLFDNPISIAALALIVLGTIGISYWVYRKGLI